ncbi:hypothetical protein [Paraburkholderia atlantica]|uniref:hypothetical protein n=1 Tax=Paraburkholderia atlantica TaxID=2654982 RepID=UPI001389D289|nr:hypothetical protein [Paraburkholderia atlantica]
MMEAWAPRICALHEATRQSALIELALAEVVVFSLFREHRRACMHRVTPNLARAATSGLLPQNALQFVKKRCSRMTP